MTTNNIVRCAFIIAITYVAWQVILPVCNTTWIIVLTVLTELTFAAVLGYILLQTSGGTHRTPSAVRDRVREKIEQQRARFPK